MGQRTLQRVAVFRSNRVAFTTRCMTPTKVWSNIIALVLLLVAPASAGSGNFTEAERRELCAHAANDGRWRCNGTLGADMPPPVEGWQWSEDAVELCGTHHHTLEAALQTTAGSWVVFMGDSITRHLFEAYLQVMDPDFLAQAPKRGNVNHELPCGGYVSYFWAAYPNVVSIMLGNLKERACNSSKLNKDEKSLEHRLPDLVVVSAGMWAILEEHHRRNVTEQGGQHGLQGYQRDLINLATDLKQRVPCAPGASAQTAQQGHRMLPAFSHIVPLVWVNIPRPQYGKLPDHKKMLTLDKVNYFNWAVVRANLLRPQGPAYLLDMHHITQDCGPSCSVDGVHSTSATYQVGIQALLNIIPHFKGKVPFRVGHSREHFNGTRLPAECIPPLLSEDIDTHAEQVGGDANDGPENASNTRLPTRER